VRAARRSQPARLPARAPRPRQELHGHRVPALARVAAQPEPADRRAARRTCPTAGSRPLLQRHDAAGHERMQSLQSLMLANEALFSDMLPDFARGKAATVRTAWSTRRIRLKNRFEIRTRAWRTSTRGAHPQLVVLDDVLERQNTLTQYQRDKSWRYFQGTLMPMNAKQVIVIGTAFHYDDLLHRLKPDKRKAPLVVHGPARPVRVAQVPSRQLGHARGALARAPHHRRAGGHPRRGRAPVQPRVPERSARRRVEPVPDGHDRARDRRRAAAPVRGDDPSSGRPTFSPLPPESAAAALRKDPYEFVVLSGDMALSSNGSARTTASSTSAATT
jgi:hypothetical protein